MVQSSKFFSGRTVLCFTTRGDPWTKLITLSSCTLEERPKNTMLEMLKCLFPYFGSILLQMGRSPTRRLTDHYRSPVGFCPISGSSHKHGNTIIVVTSILNTLLRPWLFPHLCHGLSIHLTLFVLKWSGHNFDSV